jgi:uncharacterized membrane protein YgcG
MAKKHRSLMNFVFDQNRTNKIDTNVKYTISTENMSRLSGLATPLYHVQPQVQAIVTYLVPSKTILPLLKITSRLPRRMCLLMIIKLLARELALADFVLVLVRRDTVFVDAIAMAVFDGLGDVGDVGGFVEVPWMGGIRRSRGGRGGRGGGGGGVVEGCGADGGGRGEPRGS